MCCKDCTYGIRACYVITKETNPPFRLIYHNKRKFRLNDPNGCCQLCNHFPDCLAKFVHKIASNPRNDGLSFISKKNKKLYG